MQYFFCTSSTDFIEFVISYTFYINDFVRGRAHYL